MAEKQELTTEAKKQREKAATKEAALGVEKFTVKVAEVFKPDLRGSWLPTVSIASRWVTSCG